MVTATSPGIYLYIWRIFQLTDCKTDFLIISQVQRCIKRSTGGKPVISCDFYEKAPEVDKLNLQSLFQIVENEKQKLVVSHPFHLEKDFLYLDQTGFKDELSKMGYPKFPTSMPTKSMCTGFLFGFIL